MLSSGLNVFGSVVSVPLGAKIQGLSLHFLNQKLEYGPNTLLNDRTCTLEGSAEHGPRGTTLAGSCHTDGNTE